MSLTAVEGLTGLVCELQVCYEHHHEHTGALQVLWNALTGKTPWTDLDNYKV